MTDLRQPSLAAVIADALDARLGQVHTSRPGRVVSYDSAKQTIDVQPLVHEVFADDEGAEAERLPQLRNVPVAFPRAGDNWITFPLAAGDDVLLIFCERSIDAWRATDAEGDPGELRMHALSDAIALPGIAAAARALTTSATAMVINAADELHLGGLDPSEFVALATKTLDAINAVVTGVNTLITAYNAHPHGTPMGPSGPPTVPASTLSNATDVAATKVKAV